MSTERDELADIIATHNNTSGLGKVARRLPDNAPVYEGEQLLATLILAAGWRKPRVVTTAEELNALPHGAALLTSDFTDTALLKDGNNNVFRNQSGYEVTAGMLINYGSQPFTVLWEGAQP